MNEIKGYVQIRRDATSCKGAKNPKEFMGEICAVMEFDTDGGAMIFNPQMTALGMFDKCDIVKSFRCDVLGNVICPPDLNFADQMTYASKCATRRGGYGNIISHMVIAASLHSGEFNDKFLWTKQ